MATVTAVYTDMADTTIANEIDTGDILTTTTLEKIVEAIKHLQDTHNHDGDDGDGGAVSGGLQGGHYWGGNLIRGFPGSTDGAQPGDWAESSGNVTLTDEDATGAGIPQKHERLFKIVNSGGSGSANRIEQILTIATEHLLDASVSKLSIGCWVYTASAGTMTLEMYNTGGTASLGTDTTTTTSAWVWLELKDRTIGTTSVAFRVYHSADPATFYMTLPMANIGAVVRPWESGVLGRIVQLQTTKTSAVATGTTALPWDDTIPQNTEGDQYLSLAITPKSKSSLMIIDVVINVDHSGTNNMGVALFQDSTAGALAVIYNRVPVADTGHSRVLQFVVAPGTTATTTYKIRANSQNGSTFTLNGYSGSRTGGGVQYSSMTITEYYDGL